MCLSCVFVPCNPAVSAGKCAELLKSSPSCKDVEPGEAAVASCISDLVSAAEAGDSDAGLCVWGGGAGFQLEMVVISA
mgnify:CR=1 FL=1